MVSTSEDEISELRSYDSNESVLDSEEEDRSDNDLEVMEILGHTEIQQTNQLNAQPEVVAIADFNAVFNGLEKKVRAGIQKNHFIRESLLALYA